MIHEVSAVELKRSIFQQLKDSGALGSLKVGVLW